MPTTPVARKIKSPTPTRTAPRPIIREPKVLVFKEKHGDRYFNIPDDKTLFRVSLKILTERFEAGYWYYKPGDEDKPKAPDFTKEQVAAMPDSLREGATKKLVSYQGELRRWERDSEDFNNVKKAVETKDGRLAWQCLLDYSDGEYQRCSLEQLEDPESDED